MLPHTFLKTLFDHLSGFSALMNECSRFSILCDMLKIADFYDIPSPIPLLRSKIKEAEITLENLVEAYKTSQQLADIQSFKEMALNLQVANFSLGIFSLKTCSTRFIIKCCFKTIINV